MIIHSNFSMMKSKIVPTCLQGNYRDSLGEFSNTSYGIYWAERVNACMFCVLSITVYIVHDAFCLFVHVHDIHLLPTLL